MYYVSLLYIDLNVPTGPLLCPRLICITLIQYLIYEDTI